MQYDESTHIEPGSQSARVIIFDPQYRVLLVQEQKQVAGGLWHIPAGHIEPGESPKQAAIRAALEETGMDVELGQLLGAYAGRLPSGNLVVRYVWIARPIAFADLAQTPTAEIADRRYFSLNEVQTLYAQGKLRMY